MKTHKDLFKRAEAAIARDEDFIYDVAAEYSQITANVKHMSWFRKAVAQYLIDNFKEWEHLEDV